jgi:hypothetical protein
MENYVDRSKLAEAICEHNYDAKRLMRECLALMKNGTYVVKECFRCKRRVVRLARVQREQAQYFACGPCRRDFQKDDTFLWKWFLPLLNGGMIRYVYDSWNDNLHEEEWNFLAVDIVPRERLNEAQQQLAKWAMGLPELTPEERKSKLDEECEDEDEEVYDDHE